jgi:hypothetical protein
VRETTFNSVLLHAKDINTTYSCLRTGCCIIELIYQRDQLRYQRRHISQSTCRNMFKPSTRRKLGKVKRLGGRKMLTSRVSASAFPKGLCPPCPAPPGQKPLFVLDAGGLEIKNPPTRRTAVRVHAFAARLAGPVLGLACHHPPTSLRPATNASQSGPEDARLVDG